MAVENIECPLVDVLAEIDSLMRTRATEKGIAFAIEYQTPVPQRVLTDPTRFRQILMNLVGNAVKFTDEGSVRILVSCKEQSAQDGIAPGRTHIDPTPYHRQPTFAPAKFAPDVKND
jgi:signal transduction histidine kinase